MPKYPDADLAQFMHFVKQVDSHFERYRDSSLHPLIEQLKHDSCSPDRIRNLVGQIPDDKKNKYQAALDHLTKSYLTPARPAAPVAPPLRPPVGGVPIPAVRSEE